MRLRKIRFVGVVFLFLAFVTWSGSGKGQDGEEQANITIEATTSKALYLLGETVFVKFKVTNNSSQPQQIPEVWGGNLVSISSDGKEYRKVSRGKWEEMHVKLGQITLEPGQSHEYPFVDVLFGGIKPDYSHLNPQRAKELEKQNDRVVTGYAFTKAGKPFIKGTLGIYVSEPVRIVVNEPEGDDLAVWDKIKDSGDFAYFMQYGDTRIPESKAEDRAKFLANVEQILLDHPNSFYVESLRHGLAKFRANEEKRVDFLRKLQKPQ